MLALEEIVALADAVAPMGGIASGIGTMSYGAHIIIEAPSADGAVELAIPSFIRAATEANLPSWPVTHADAISEEDDPLDDE